MDGNEEPQAPESATPIEPTARPSAPPPTAEPPTPPQPDMQLIDSAYRGLTPDQLGALKRER